jgi:hypothetical protein
MQNLTIRNPLWLEKFLNNNTLYGTDEPRHPPEKEKVFRNHPD